MITIRAGKYWEGKWPFDSWEGVGLEFKGVPTNEPRFIEILQNESCNPVAAHLTLKALKDEGIKLTTVMSGFDFERLIDDLATVGVTCNLVPPRQQQEGLDQIYGMALQLALGKVPDGDRRLLAEARIKASLVTLDPTTLGPFSHAAN